MLQDSEQTTCTQRSQKKELIDLGPEYYSPEEYQLFLKKIFWVNKRLGIFRDTVKAIQRFPTATSLVDVGCGGGHFLLHLAKYFPAMYLLGIDINADAIQTAKRILMSRAQSNYLNNVAFYLQPQPELQLPQNSVDVILATLVCHHLSDSELIDFLRTAVLTAKQAVIINDLYRHRLAQWSYRLLSPLSRSRLIIRDGLISIQKGFIHAEWELLLAKAGIKHYRIALRFPFRWQVILWK
jgi:SAM-dependent methyltransferase